MRNVSILPLVVSFLISAASCAASSSRAPAGRVPNDTKGEPLAGASLVLDVRTPEEYAQGHLQSAKLIPVAELEDRLAEVEAAVSADKSKKIVVYCGSGRRAEQAKLLLEGHGYTSVVNGGGYTDLK